MNIQELYTELKKQYGQWVSIDDDTISGQSESGWYSIEVIDGKIVADHEHSEYQNWMYDTTELADFVTTLADIHEDELK